MDIESRNPYMTDIYYIQVQAPAPVADAKKEQQPQQPRFTLIKLGNEIHGPQDVMYLNPAKILFWENLRADSQVVQGITKEKAQRTNTPAQVPQVPTDTNVMQPAGNVPTTK